MNNQDILNQIPTEAGKSYFKQVMDPYHDFNYDTVGAPDGLASASFVRSFKQRKSIVIPSHFDKDSPFEVHIYTTPFLNKQAVASASVDSEAGVGLAFMAIDTTDSHYASYVTIQYIQGNLIHFDCFDLNLDVDGDSYRTVGLGVEVHNTTAELYKSGSVTVYRSNPYLQNIDAAVVIENDRTYPLQRFDVGHTLPSNVIQANAMQNAVTWEAKEGVYFVAQPLPENNFSSFSSRAMVQVFGSIEEDKVRGFVPVPLVGDTTHHMLFKGTNSLDEEVIISGDISSRAIARYASTIANNVYTTGAYFTGLDPNTTMTIDTRLMLETQPGFNSSTLALAKPCPMPDLRALELIRAAVMLLPPGTLVKNNSLGKWWRAIKDVVRAVVPALSTVPGPIGQVARVVDTVDKSASKIKGQLSNIKTQKNRLAVIQGNLNKDSGRFLH